MSEELDKIFNAVNSMKSELSQGIHRVELRITAVETKQAENHGTNKEDICELSDMLRKCNDRLAILPCEAHKVKFENYDKNLSENTAMKFAMFMFLLGLIGTWVSQAVAYGKTIGKIERIIENESVVLQRTDNDNRN
jgi:hypothetical protein